MKCRKGGKSGYKWGRGGACVTGPGAKAKVGRMGKAIKAKGGK